MAINYNLGGDYSSLASIGPISQTPITEMWQNTDWSKNPMTPIPTAQPAPQAGPTAEDLYWQQRAAYDAEMKTQAQNSVRDSVAAIFNNYGLGSLYGKIEEWAKMNYSADTIVIKLRETPEYKQRFPAMDALAKKGRAIDEGSYIQYERNAAELEQQYGLPKGMLMGNVTRLLTEEVSAVELADRVKLASADSLNAPDDLKQTLKDYYGLDPETALNAYYLDPEVALPLLQKQSATARIGTWATRQGLNGVGVSTSERLQELGVSEQQAQEGFGRVKYTEQFGSGKGETAGQDVRIAANLEGSAGAMQKVERVKTGRTNRFAGGGQYAGGNSGVSGLGSSGN